MAISPSPIPRILPLPGGPCCVDAATATAWYMTREMQVVGQSPEAREALRPPRAVGFQPLKHFL